MGKIWAIAANTIKQALRLKIAVAFTLLLLILLPVLGSVMTGDGTLQGRLQTFISYGLSLTSLLLSLLTIIISIYTLTSDFATRQIYTVITKPIRRWQLLTGKLLGVIILNAVLLTVFSGIIYGITIYTPQMVSASDYEIARADTEFFTARKGITPLEADVSQQAQEMFDRRLRAGEIPEQVLTSPSQRRSYMNELQESLRLQNRSVPAGHNHIWEFHNIRPADPDRSIYIRFKYEAVEDTPGNMIRGGWIIGDLRPMLTGEPADTPIYGDDRNDPVRTAQEIEVPADAIADDGYLAVRFSNAAANRTVVMFPAGDGLEVLYKAGSFEGNFIRAVLLIFIRLVFLAILGIMSATFLSFPVAILLCLVVFVTGISSTFVMDSLAFFETDTLSVIYDFTIKPLLYMIPRLDVANPSQYLIPARLISWSFVGHVTLATLAVKGLLLFMLAILIFAYRELAKIVV